MKLELTKPIKALNKAYLKEKVSRNHIELFKKNLQQLLGRINEQESEEHLKNVIADFLKDTWYKDQFEINTKERNDLVIHTGKTSKELVGVILEVKKPSNKAEMMTTEKPNVKALQELILYYLKERVEHNNTDIKYLIVTNIYEWFIMDEVWFEKNVFRNSKLKKDYDNWKLSGKDTKFFYESIAKSFLNEVAEEMPVTYFDIRTYEKYVTNTDKEDDTKLIGLYKILSPAHLLKQAFINDSNSLDTKFYTELLHIIGLEEIKDGGKKLIKRKAISDEASLLENTIIKLEDKDALRSVNNISSFGSTKQEQLFNVALELCITWVNRVLFIKLLEAQLYKYHKGNAAYLFLNSKLVFDFDELSNLFFQVLAEKPESRRNHIQEKFSKVPYLNSSLFERIELERQTINISELDNRLQLPLSNSSVLKDDKGKRKVGTLPTLQYLFEFLDAYDFTSEGGEEIQEENKNLINASVLGLIFEKINGYKDGSFFTPGFVTMYMCKETIRRAVLQKFNDTKGWQCDTIDSLFNKIDDKKEANKIINSLHICDPAVGSGHFLVSALNEMIAIKSELKILQDATGKSLRDYHVEVVNDELIITDEDGKLFDYNPQNKESQRIQETLFHEKETIIENCLFGVDINTNSVKICRLRLWIELLKNAYYTTESNYLELETLPNIDINIKCGNSLISRFALDADIKSALKKSNFSITAYRSAVQNYRAADNKDEKREMESLINKIKNDFQTEIGRESKQYKDLAKLELKYFKLYEGKLFDHKISKQEAKARTDMSALIEKGKIEIEEIKGNKIYENAFEWRFEFPEVLNDAGDFIGFDVVIGNPPYGVKEKGKKYLDFVELYYPIARKVPDSYFLFMIRGNEILSKNCEISFIVPNTFCDIEQGDEFRNWFLTSNNLIKLYDSSWVFQDAIVDTVIYFQTKEKKNNETLSIVSNDFSEKEISISNIKNNRGHKIDYRAKQEHKNLLSKIELGSVPLVDLSIIKAGVKLYEKGKGNPKQTDEIINKKDYTKIGEKPNGWRRLIRGGDISRYGLKQINEYVNYGEWLAAPRDNSLFTGERVVIRRTDDIIRATFVNDDSICVNSCHVLVSKNEENIKLLLAILNSKLLQWVFEIKNPQMVGKAFAEIKVVYVESLPIKFPINTKEIQSHVEEILKLKAVNSMTDITSLENEIDKLVYQSYGLTEDEINIIERK
jgi:adenine-specific DNA-methyltransferase